MTMNMRRSFACAISALLFAGIVPTFTSPAQAAEMTPEQAGAYYLTHECRNGLSLFLFLDELSRDGQSVRFADVKKRFARFKKETNRLGAAQARFATKLLNPPDVWPAQVASPVQAVAEAGLKSAAILDRAAQASTPSAWWRKFKKANNQIIKVEDGKTQLRTLLSLPPFEC